MVITCFGLNDETRTPSLKPKQMTDAMLGNPAIYSFCGVLSFDKAELPVDERSTAILVFA